MNRTGKIGLTIVIASMLAACASFNNAVQQPLNWATPNSSVGVAMLQCSPRLKIISLDGDKSKNFNNREPFGPYRQCLITLSPGPHMLVVEFNVAPYSSKNIPVSFNFEPKYEYKFNIVGHNGFIQTFNVNIVQD